MKPFAAALCPFLLPLAAAAADIPIPVPSGQTVTYFETIQNAQGPEGLTYRFRFIAPAIARDGGTVDADTALLDMEFLCNTFAMKAVPSTGPQPAQIVISLADRPVPFGEPAPEATQFFEAFRPEDGACVWEGF
ncbi:DUF6497 family protein [Frigidibacter sp. SD6-1]|uniref:DUF6497 family protein n=1 Tax=Frigidibacter sp. SD6-1 TaxID=3032581 RepID=UPI0024DF74E4|nr:DUF6497 family protein [Frigidibacter sp. SD6-1]